MSKKIKKYVLPYFPYLIAFWFFSKCGTAYRMAGEYVRRTRPGGRVFIVHRLDRDTSGVLLFAKDEEAKRAYQEHWYVFQKVM